MQFFEGFIARDAARLHTSDGEPAAALGLFAEAITAFQRAGNVPQLIITLASVPALFERLGRPEPAATLLGALSNEPSSAHHVPELARARRPAQSRPRAEARRAADRRPEPRSISAMPPCTPASSSTPRAATRHPSPRQERPGGLSRREVEVLRLVADGRTAGEIATELFISKRTAEHHVAHIYTKIGVANRAAATRWAVQHRVVEGTVTA